MTRSRIAWLLLLPGLALAANDGVVSIAAGGLVQRSERRVAMRKERLYISPSQVRVDYEFVNESAKDVTVQVGFPMPEYADDSFLGARDQDFEDFKVVVDGVEKPYRTEIKAFQGGRDVTAVLEKLRLDVASLGLSRMKDRGPNYISQMTVLPEPVRKRLLAQGLLRDSGQAGWSVKRTYHWTQTFPAGKVVRVSHTYQPLYGAYGLKPYREFVDPGRSDLFCLSPDLRKDIQARADDPKRIHPGETVLPFYYVDYILTTANTWKTPIGDFELVAEGDPGQRVALCWNGPVQVEEGGRRVRAAAKDFVPRGELKVGFLFWDGWDGFKLPRR